MEPTCSFCHSVVRTMDYYCFNCGKKLHEKQLSTSLSTQIMYYLGSILLTPLGLWWGYKYLKQNDQTARKVGIFCIILTIISFIVISLETSKILSQVASQMNSQLNVLQGY